MPDPAATCPKCARPIQASAPHGLCPACMVSSFFDVLGEDPELVAPEMPAPAGPRERVGGYELLEQIGRGGMGVVFRARDLRLDRIVALKLLLSGKLASEMEVKRFRAEAGAAAQLEHPNIVPIYEVGEDQGWPFFTMKLVEPGNLADRMTPGGCHLPEVAGAGGGKPPVAAVACLLAKVARAVHFAHQHGILHRDLKPANILLDHSGEPFVTDFGLARRLESGGNLTVSGDVFGTPSYMAPETAAHGSREATTASDIYSLGAVLYEMLTGRPPFQADTVPALLRKIAEEEPLAPSRVRPDTRRGERGEAANSGVVPTSTPAVAPSLRLPVARDLETICLKCLAKNPAGRYTSALTLAEDLDRWLRGEPILARPTPWWEHVLKWSRRKPAWGVVVLLLLLAPAVIIAVLLVGQARVRRAQAWTRLNLYAADMQVAQNALEDANLSVARQMLDTYRPRPGEPDLRGFEWRYLWQRTRTGQLRVLRAHSQPVNCLAFSPDGNWLASCEVGRTVWFWSTTSWRAERVIDWSGPSRSPFRWLAFSRDGTRLVLSQDDPYCPIFEMASLQSQWCVFSRSPGAGFVSRVLWSSASDKLVFLPLGEPGERPACVLDWTNFLARPGRQIALATNGLVVQTGRTNSFAYPDAPARRLSGVDAFHSATADGHLLASRDGHLLDIDLERDVAPVLIPSVHHFDYCERAGNGRFLAGFNTEPKDRHSVLLDEFQPGITNYWEMIGHEGDLRCLAISPDSRFILSGSADHTARIWDVATRKTVADFRGHTDEVTAVAWSPDGKLAATGSKDHSVMLWAAQAAPRPDEQPEALFGAFAPWLLSTDGTAMVSATRSQGQSRLVVTTFASRERTELPSQASLTPLRLSSCGRELLALSQASGGGLELRNWSVAAGTNSLLRRIVLPAGITLNQRTVWGVSPDGRWLACGWSGGGGLWQLDQAAGFQQLPVPGETIHGLAFSQQGNALALWRTEADGSAIVALWTLAKNVLKAGELKLPTAINALDWSPDGATLAIACENATVQLLAARTLQPLRALTGHKRAVTAVAFSGDGRTLASGDGRTIQLWQSATGRAVFTIYRDIKADSVTRWLAFAPDDARLLAADTGGRVQVFAAPPLAQADRSQLGD